MRPVRLPAASEAAVVARLGLSTSGPARGTRIPHQDWVGGLCTQLRAADLGPDKEEQQREYRFHTSRKWRADLALFRIKLLIEVDGGSRVPGKSGHTNRDGFERDRRRDAEALLLGWRTLRLTPPMIKDGYAVTVIAALLGKPLELKCKDDAVGTFAPPQKREKRKQQLLLRK